MIHLNQLSETQYFEKLVLAKLIQFEELKNKFTLAPEFFEDRRHQNIADMIIKNSNFSYEDMITQAAMDPGYIGDYDFVREIYDMDVVTKHNFNFEQEKVLNDYKIREIDKAIMHYQGNKTSETVSEINASIHHLSKIDVTKDNRKFETISKIFDSLFSEGDSPIIKTQIDDLDKLIDGIEPQQFNVIAARPSMGKTAFALQLAMNIQADNTEVIFCSAESTEENMTRRILSNLSKVPLQKFKHASEMMTTEDIDKVTTALSVYHKMNITIIDDAIFTPNKIRSIVNGMDDFKNKIVIIDYLQLMKSDRKTPNRFEEVSEISRELKIISGEFENLSIIALSQLSRAVESRQDKRPIMSDIRETGQIEQDANMIMFLYREDYYSRDQAESDSPGDELEVIVAKNKDGALGTARVQFFKDIQRMY